MKITFLITTKGHGKGGHFHSLNTIANAIGKKHDVQIFNIGVKISESLNEENCKIKFVRYTGYNFLQTYFKLKKQIKSIQPDVVHAFDVESFAFSRLLSKVLNQPSYLNKCGGPNPKMYFPKANNLVLFSIENQVYFNNNSGYSRVNTVVIPNRVKTIVPDQNRIDDFYKKHNKNSEVTILRIARIGKHYHQSILQGINLVEWLIKQGRNVKFIIVGAIQNIEVLEDINFYIKEKGLSDNVIIETSDKFTTQASEILDVGDVILGTGRNFMEACSLGKTMLVPYKNESYPLLVNEDNFHSIFTTNFSPRTQVKAFNEKENLNSILKIIDNNIETNSEKWFNSYFNVDVAVSKYTELYRILPKKNTFVFDSIVNIAYSIRTFLKR